MLNNLYREFLIERKSIYPAMSFAANQRLASRSGYIVPVKEGDKVQILSERITP